MVAHHLAKVRVAGSNPVFRSLLFRSPVFRSPDLRHRLPLSRTGRTGWQRERSPTASKARPAREQRTEPRTNFGWNGRTETQPLNLVAGTFGPPSVASATRWARGRPLCPRSSGRVDSGNKRELAPTSGAGGATGASFINGVWTSAALPLVREVEQGLHALIERDETLTRSGQRSRSNARRHAVGTSVEAPITDITTTTIASTSCHVR